MSNKNESFVDAVTRMYKMISERDIEVTDEWDNVNQAQRKEVRIRPEHISVVHEIFNTFPSSDGWFVSMKTPSGTPVIVTPWG